LFKDLSATLGGDSVFMDVDAIALGRDFREAMRERLASCDIMLTLIGKDWVGITDASGRKRLADPDDFVRLEIEAALKRGIPVIPVLVQGAEMPSLDELPPEIRNFAFRNAFELSHTRWESDVHELIRRLALDRQSGERSASGGSKLGGSSSAIRLPMKCGHRTGEAGRTTSERSSLRTNP
jgi:hypothetical protein